MSATDATINKKIHGYATKTIRFSNKDLDDMAKIVKTLEYSNVLMKGITRTLKNNIKKGGALPFIPMLLGTLGASLSTGRGMYRAGNQGQGLFSAGRGIKKKSLTPFHPLTNIETMEYFKDEPIFNGVYSRNNLPNIKKDHISLI